MQRAKWTFLIAVGFGTMLVGCAVGVQGVDESEEQGASATGVHGSLGAEAVMVNGNGAHEPGSPIFGPYNAQGAGGAARASAAGHVSPSAGEGDDSDEHSRDDSARGTVPLVGGLAR